MQVLSSWILLCLNLCIRKIGLIHVCLFPELNSYSYLCCTLGWSVFTLVRWFDSPYRENDTPIILICRWENKDLENQVKHSCLSQAKIQLKIGGVGLEPIFHNQSPPFFFFFLIHILFSHCSSSYFYSQQAQYLPAPSTWTGGSIMSMLPIVVNPVVWVCYQTAPHCSSF